MFARALAILEKKLGAEHPDTILLSLQVANTYLLKNDFVSVERAHTKALDTLTKTLGPENDTVAYVEPELAQICFWKKDYAKAEPLFRTALEVYEKTLGPNHARVMGPLYGLAEVYISQGDFAKAEPLLQRGISVAQKSLGTDSQMVAKLLHLLSLLYELKGDLRQAIGTRARAIEISERNIRLNLAAGSERQQTLYLSTFAEEVDLAVSLHLKSAPNDSTALRLALSTLLRRKGLALETATDSMAVLRRHLSGEGLTVLDGLIRARARFATLSYKRPERMGEEQYLAELQKVREAIEELEGKMSSLSAEFRAQSQVANIESVQAVIPQDAALVEIALYAPFDLKEMKKPPQERRRPTPRYVAYVLRREGSPLWVELGEASAIDAYVTALRAALRSRSDDVKAKARSLDASVMAPVRKLVGDANRILISPDGALNLIPFAALVDEQDHYLVERYSFTYLTSGRDLLRLQTRLPSGQQPLIIANPLFDLNANLGTNTAQTRQAVGDERPSRSFDNLFSSLDGTESEARALSGIFKSARVLTGPRADEAAVKQVRGPSILHVATHGFFKTTLLQADEDIQTLPGIFDQQPKAVGESPLLRSGLALAGANQLQGGGGEDGVLTALEASGLDLWGTKLVALSACETALGDIQIGEGVHGLRRALVLAGAESALISLWKVDDQSTTGLMVAYYTGLLKGEGRGEALRRVQLQMLQDEAQRHPYFWASFIQSGDWRSLEGNEPSWDK